MIARAIAKAAAAAAPPISIVWKGLPSCKKLQRRCQAHRAPFRVRS